ncbi:hypothetical protein JZ751_012900, partial [Albula glossodonta]
MFGAGLGPTVGRQKSSRTGGASVFGRARGLHPLLPALPPLVSILHPLQPNYGLGEKAIEIRSVETGHLDGVFMHKRAQRLKFLSERETTRQQPSFLHDPEQKLYDELVTLTSALTPSTTPTLSVSLPSVTPINS